MRPRGSTLTKSFAILAALLTVAACSASGTNGADGSANGDTPDKAHVGSMVLGVANDAFYASVLVAVKEGFLKQNGVDGTLKVFANGTDALSAVLTGQSDFTGNSQYNVPFVAAQGGNVRIIGEYETSGKQFGATAVQSITKPEDLIGKTVATQFGSGPQYWYNLYLQHHGLDPSKIKLVNLKFAQMVAALARGDIQAYFANEPQLSQGVTTVSGSHILARSGDENVMLARGFMGVSQKVYSNPKLAAAFITAMKQAGQWANSHRDETAKLVSDNFHLTLDDAKRYVTYFDYSQVDLSCDALKSIADVTTYLVAQKLVQTKPDVDSFVDSSFMKTADPSSVCQS